MRRDECYLAGKWDTYLVSDVRPNVGLAIRVGRRQPDPVIHHVDNIRLLWVAGRAVALQGRVRCHARHWFDTIRLAGEAPAIGRKCTQCATLTTPVGPPQLYLARTERGLKVGISGRLDQRIAAIQGDLLATVPGTRADETRIIRALKAHRNPVTVGAREWFVDTPEVEAEARRLLADVALEAAA